MKVLRTKCRGENVGEHLLDVPYFIIVNSQVYSYYRLPACPMRTYENRPSYIFIASCSGNTCFSKKVRVILSYQIVEARL